MTIKSSWESIKKNIINKDTRQKVFVSVSTLIFILISIACVVINFTTREMVIAYAAVGSLVLLTVLLVVESIVFIKKIKIHVNYFAISMALTICSLAFIYFFYAPADSLYIYWVCIIPIVFALSFGFKKGTIISAVMFLLICLVFYVPGIYQLTRTENVEQHWLMKTFFAVHYLACVLFSVLLDYVNSTIINRLEDLKNLYYDEANTDSLTGLKNQAFYLTYVNSLPKVVEMGDTIGLMFIDVDDFKLVNDTYGHTKGNEVLVSIANKLNEVPHALIVRWGGDEFAIVERNVTRDEFIAKAHYLLKSVEALPQHVTISIGLAYYVVDENFNFQKIFDEADMQAIRAKGKGKNCVIIKEKK